MSNEKLVPLMLSIPKTYRDLLRQLAAKRNLEDCDQVSSAASIGRELLCRSLDELRTPEENE